MKRFLCVCIFSTLVFADTVTIDFRSLKSSSVDVDMMNRDGVEILVNAGSEPEVIISNGPLAQCQVRSVKAMDAKSYRIEVNFVPVLDDGMNGCIVLVASPGRMRRINLAIYVEN